MATVTGMTAAAMIAIRNGMVTGAHFDSAGHLILTKYDGTTVDAGVVTAATTSLAGVVELATSAETQTGTDATRAVTPAGLASLPSVKILGASSVAESATYSSYPNGVSLMDASGWSLGSGFGTVVTHNIGGGFRCAQTFYSASGGTSQVQSWVRHYNSADGGGGWTAWRRNMAMANLTAGSYTQNSTISNFPEGFSRLYYTSGTSGSWDFSGQAGEVITYRDGTDFARQTFTTHANGSANTPDIWVRTANAAGGWSAWKKLLHDPGAWTSYTPSWTTQTGLHTPSFGNATLDCRYLKIGRKVDVRFNIVFGSTTNFGSSVTGSDNWWFGLPTPFPAARSSDEGLGYMDYFQSSTTLGFARVKLVSTTQIGLSILTSFSAGNLATGIGGDVDSISPFTFASGNTLKGSFTYESAA